AGQGDLFITDVLTHETIQIEDGKVQAFNPLFAPDNQSILYQAADADYAIYSLSLETGFGKLVTNNLGGAEIVGNWSPDSNRFAYRIQRGIGTDTPLDYLYYFDLTLNRESFFGSTSTSDQALSIPVFSPDGSQIALIQSKGGVADSIIFFHPDDETFDEISVPVAPIGNYKLAWSPDGQTIAFIAPVEDNNQIFGLNLADQTTTQLTSAEFGTIDFTWSPDGKSMIYAARRPSDKQATSDLMLLHLDNGEVGATEQLSGDDTLKHNLAWSSVAADSSESPAGYIAFECEVDSTDNLCMLDLKTNEIQTLTTYSDSDPIQGFDWAR
ncbi:MAG TPA: hypothetical protein VHL11_18075, partial [Phototrophicaceae bacterium]|nr:hypothetical protein [Phototrophicaceae bacterium]